MKKLILLIILLLIISMAPVDAAKTVVITIGGSSGRFFDNPKFDRIMRRYSEIHPNIIVKKTELEPWECLSNVSDKQKNVKTPDIIILNEYLLAGYSSQLTNLNNSEFNAKQFEKSMVPYVWAKGTDEKNHLIGFPLDVMPICSYYRKDIFKKAGVNIEKVQTLSDLFMAAEKITKNRDCKFHQYFLPTATKIASLIIDSSPNPLVNRNGDKWDIDRKRVSLAISWGRKFYKAGCDFGPKYSRLPTIDYYKDGSVAYDVSGPMDNLFENLSKDSPEFNSMWSVVQCPAINKNEERMAAGSGLAVDFLSIPKKAKFKKEAWLLIQYICTEKPLILTSSPAYIRVWDDSYFDEKIKVFGGQRARRLWNSIARSVPAVKTSKYDLIARKIIDDEMDSMIYYDKNVDLVVGEIQKKIEVECNK